MYILWPKSAKRSESKSTISQLAISRDPSAFGGGYGYSLSPSNVNDSSSESGLDTFADVTNFKQSMINSHNDPDNLQSASLDSPEFDFDIKHQTKSQLADPVGPRSRQYFD